MLYLKAVQLNILIYAVPDLSQTKTLLSLRLLVYSVCEIETRGQ